MKCNYRLYGGLVLLSLVITCVFLLLMPDTVPMHYDAAGVVDRFGSKYENLVFPAIVAVVAVLFYALSKTKHVQPADGKVFFFTGLGMLIFFNILSLFFLWTALTYQPEHFSLKEYSLDQIANTMAKSHRITEEDVKKQSLISRIAAAFLKVVAPLM